MGGRQTKRWLGRPCSLLLLLVATGCGSGRSAEPFVPTTATLQQRMLTTRQFDGISESDLMSASAGVLQDLGFNIEEVETGLGLLTGTKVTESEVPGVTWFINLPGFKRADGPKEFRASVVVRPGNDPIDRTQYVRVTFHRKVWVTDVADDDKERLFIQESIDDPELYRDFFDRLSKSVFLEGQGI